MSTVTEQSAPLSSVGLPVEARLPQASAVSWAAILAGAAAAAALSLILLILGTGLGLSAVSPWANDGVSTQTLSVATIIWICFMQLAASALGGYLAGRLRTRWLQVHIDEIYFRDTAHGFLTWAVATLATAALLTSVIGSVVASGARAGASAVSNVASAAIVATAEESAAAENSGQAADNLREETTGYLLDRLLRPSVSTVPSDASLAENRPSPQNSSEAMAEITRIFANALQTGSMPGEDVQYLGQVVSQRTGLTQQEAEQRIQDTLARAQLALQEAEVKARNAADEARRASAQTAIWFFISLLMGAFIASYAAIFGGRQRDA